MFRYQSLRIFLKELETSCARARLKEALSCLVDDLIHNLPISKSHL